MKTRILLITILSVCSILGLKAQENMFDRLSNHKEITTVYISKSLLKLMPNIDAGGADIKGLVGKLEQLEIYNCEKNKDAIKMMRQEIASLVKANKYEVLMKVKEKTNNVTFYAYKEKDRIKDLIMFVDDTNDCTIIRIQGNFTTDDIQKVVEGSGKKK